MIRLQCREGRRQGIAQPKLVGHGLVPVESKLRKGDGAEAEHNEGLPCIGKLGKRLCELQFAGRGSVVTRAVDEGAFGARRPTGKRVLYTSCTEAGANTIDGMVASTTVA
eukprot:scaffold518_cov388-Prasinococcus_capsulatus_cf.AAC.50